MGTGSGRRGAGTAASLLAAFLLVVAASLVGAALWWTPVAHAQEGGARGFQRWVESLYQRDGDEPGHHSGSYYTLLDGEGRRITRTALALGVGDTYIDEGNRLYEVVRIDGRIARVEFREVVQLPDVGGAAGPGSSASGSTASGPTASASAGPGPAGARDAQRPSWWRGLSNRGPLGRWAARANLAAQANPQQGEGGGAPTVVIYHSHNAESYLPTSGREFNDDGAGDVHRVGRTLKEALEAEGVTVHWSQRLHLPHDGGAYRRSRATVREYLSKAPNAMLDVHRDAIPAEEYKTEVDGEPMTKIRLVVGRQNQNREANLEYAKEIKALADRRFPGLIKGIFHARGNYNQDVGPRMILLEFGSHETSLEEAQASARLLAQLLPETLGADSRGRVGSAGWRTVLWLLAAAVVGVLAYMRINAGSWEEFGERLRRLLRLRGRAGNR